MARQHKGEVMIAGEQLRYEGREGEHDMFMVRFTGASRSKVRQTADWIFKIQDYG